LCEDVLDPNRNVDVAFRSSNLTLKNDEVISGLQRREEGEVLIFADSTGKEIAVPKNQIKERSESELSLMPENFLRNHFAEDFNHLMAFLLSHSNDATQNELKIFVAESWSRVKSSPTPSNHVAAKAWTASSSLGSCATVFSATLPAFRWARKV